MLTASKKKSGPDFLWEMGVKIIVRGEMENGKGESLGYVFISLIHSLNICEYFYYESDL